MIEIYKISLFNENKVTKSLETWVNYNQEMSQDVQRSVSELMMWRVRLEGIGFTIMKGNY